jgi:hypothetical protein
MSHINKYVIVFNQLGDDELNYRGFNLILGESVFFHNCDRKGDETTW